MRRGRRHLAEVVHLVARGGGCMHLFSVPKCLRFLLFPGSARPTRRERFLYDVDYRSLTNWAVGITRVEAFRRTSRRSEQQLLRFGVLHRPGHRLNHQFVFQTHLHRTIGDSASLAKRNQVSTEPCPSQPNPRHASFLDKLDELTRF